MEKEIKNIKQLRMCSWCNRININGGWVGEEYHNYEFVISSYDKITHGICEDDFEKLKP